MWLPVLCKVEVSCQCWAIDAMQAIREDQEEAFAAPANTPAVSLLPAKIVHHSSGWDLLYLMAFPLCYVNQC
jgi:hypothetical protein